jgi:hypothetical protein
VSDFTCQPWHVTLWHVREMEKKERSPLNITQYRDTSPALLWNKKGEHVKNRLFGLMKTNNFKTQFWTHFWILFYCCKDNNLKDFFLHSYFISLRCLLLNCRFSSKLHLSDKKTSVSLSSPCFQLTTYNTCINLQILYMYLLSISLTNSTDLG